MEEISCPYCRYEAPLDGFDTVLADVGNVFCPSCNLEFSVDLACDESSDIDSCAGEAVDEEGHE